MVVTSALNFYLLVNGYTMYSLIAVSTATASSFILVIKFLEALVNHWSLLLIY